jgi:hypothetical protein
MKQIDITGQRFGRLIAEKPIERTPHHQTVDGPLTKSKDQTAVINAHRATVGWLFDNDFIGLKR